MEMSKMAEIKRLCLFSAVMILLTGPAAAYVGPGAGVSLIGAAIGLLVALGTAVAIVVFLPLRVIKKRRALARAAAAASNVPESSDESSS